MSRLPNSNGNPAKASEVEVQFEPDGTSVTRVEFEHRHFDRHGEGGAEYRAVLDSDQGWPYILDRYKNCEEKIMTHEDDELIAKASISIDAPVAKVWEALVNPALIKQYMFGTDVVTDWKEGSPIVWQGEWQGRSYEDRGTILKLDRERLLQYSHFSPLSGKPDVPENYHTVTIELSSDGNQTNVSLTQDNNATEQDRDHSEKNWQMMLEGLKEILEDKKDT